MCVTFAYLFTRERSRQLALLRYYYFRFTCAILLLTIQHAYRKVYLHFRLLVKIRSTIFSSCTFSRSVDPFSFSSRARDYFARCAIGFFSGCIRDPLTRGAMGLIAEGPLSSSFGLFSATAARL